MSLLADILSKVTPRKIDGDVPPTLTRVVLDSRNRVSQKRRLLATACVSACLIVAGISAIHYLDLFARSGLLTPSARTQLQASKEELPRIPRQEASETAGPGTAAAVAPEPQVTNRPSAATLKNPEGVPQKPALRRTDRSASSISTAAPVARPTEGGEPADPGKEMAAKQRTERDELLYEARNREAAGEYGEALGLYKKILDTDRQNYVVLNNIAGILIAKGAFKEGGHYAQASLEANRAYAPSLVNLAIASIRLGSIEEGKTHLVRALSLEPSNTRALLNIALLHETQQNFEEAKRYYSMLANLKDSQGYLGVARVAEKIGKLDDAIRAYRGILDTEGIDDGTKKFAAERLTGLER